MGEAELQLKPLKIGPLTAEYPVIQGGMGVGISLSSLAGAVAKAGGIGIISTAQIGFKDPDFSKDPMGANLRAIHEELKKARKTAPDGILGFNIMVATKEYARYVKEAVKAGADVIISGAGLPVDLPRYVKEAAEEMGEECLRRPMLAPIVSSIKSASVICKMWDRKHKMAPDFVVVEGPCAGGHLGFSREELSEYEVDTQCVSKTYKREKYEAEIRGIIGVVKEFAGKYKKEIPVVTAGGIFDHEDVLRQLRLGADGVQVATRFVTTEECDADPAYKQAYLDAEEKDIVIVKSPVGMPGRAIRNRFLERVQEGRIPVKGCFRCLEHCNPAETPYCITRALIHAAEGNIEEALLFCGSNAYRCKRIETVPEVMRNFYMLNYLWAGMMALGILWGAFHGNLAQVTNGALDSAREAVTLCLTMLGIMSFWCGILKVGEEAGLIEALTKKMRPVIRLLFPDMPEDHPAAAHISTNMIANMLGLGWAATPAGLKAMEELEALEEERRRQKKPGAFGRGTASNEMCTFLIVNISSLQLIPINMIAYRSQYGSVSPSAIVGPALAATAVSTLTGVAYCLLKRRR